MCFQYKVIKIHLVQSVKVKLHQAAHTYMRTYTHACTEITLKEHSSQYTQAAIHTHRHVHTYKEASYVTEICLTE